MRKYYAGLLLLLTGCASTTAEDGTVSHWPLPHPELFLWVGVTWGTTYVVYRWLCRMPVGYYYVVSPGPSMTMYDVEVFAPNDTRLPRSWGHFESLWMPWTKTWAAHKARTHSKYGKQIEEALSE